MMTRRFGTYVALAVGCLVAVAGANACSSGDNRDDNNNTGTPDAGTPVQHPDAGTQPTNEHGIGGACTVPAGTTGASQGDCDTGLTCIPDSTTFPGGMCVKLGCTDDASCGTGATCVDLGQDQSGQNVHACFKSCDTGVIGSCDRNGFVCQPTGFGKGLCQPDCNTTGCASDSLTCNADGTCGGAVQAFGECDETDLCQAGQDCLGFSSGGPQFCMPDCTAGANTCPQGSTCVFPFSDPSGAKGKACAKNCDTNTDCAGFGNWTCQSNGATKICAPPAPTGTQQPGQPCGGASGACAAGSRCLGSGSSGFCFQGTCTTNTDCTSPPGSTCSIQVQGTGNFCALACTQGGTACPAPTTCKAFGGGNFCLE